MKVIILAAGEGTRMRSLTNRATKCLLEIKGKSIVGRQLEAINRICSNILFVVGYKKDKIIDKLGYRYSYIENKDYKSTNSIYSLWLAKNELNDDLVLLNSDIIFDYELMDAFIKKPSDICVALSTNWSLDRGYKVEMRRGNVVRMGTNIQEDNIYGEYAGIVKINKSQLPIFKKYLDKNTKGTKPYRPDHFPTTSLGHLMAWFYTDKLKHANGHEMVYDKETLRFYLVMAGFSKWDILACNKCSPVFEGKDFAKYAGWSLYVEVTK